MPAEIPAGRRAIVRGEHLFPPASRAKKCRPHVWVATQIGASGPVIACMLCGKLKQGETMPSWLEPLVP